MRIIADLHIHSKYSRACSQNLTPANIDHWCQLKGINLIGAADFTHPAWFKELKNDLIEKETGLYQLKNSNSPVRFIFSTEVSCIYKQGDQCRRLHLVIISPSMATAEKINQRLEKMGFNLRADGRPILGLSAKELTKIVLEIDEKNLVIPAHIWTPWFAVFGSKSGFNSLAECFEEYTPYIYALETGLSSDPAMNWLWSALDDLTLISNSDAHSLANLGREANVWETDKLDYNEVYQIIKNHDPKKFLLTIEFFPEEGKYHYDGHANCHYVASPQESKKQKNLCPICHKELILGVSHRVSDLADREKPLATDKIPYKNLIPLQEIIADVFGSQKNSKKVQTEYLNLVQKHSEFALLLDLNEAELTKATGPLVAQTIIKMRAGQVTISPGYDGVYGQVKILSAKPKQKNLF